MCRLKMKRKDNLICALGQGRYPQMPPFYLLRRMWWRKTKGLELLVLGSGRGGTSLLATLLDAHPQLEVHMEAEVQAYLVEPDRRKYLSPIDQLEAFRRANEALAKKSKLRFGNKITTEQLGFIEDFGRNLAVRELVRTQVLAKPKIVFIVRDGRSCISSKIERTQANYPTALAYWKHSIAYLQYLQEQQLQVHLIRFEDLLSTPREVLQEVCNFLDLGYSESMLSGTDSDRILVDYRQQGLDVDKAARSIHPSVKVGDIESELAYLGYKSGS